MSLNVGKEISDLRRMTLPELRERFAEVFGEPSTSRHKDFLLRRIIWKLQANEQGGLSERARQRATELAATSDVRLTPPPLKAVHAPERTRIGHIKLSQDNRVPLPGATLVREYKSEQIEVRVLPKGFDYKGEVYRTLSAVAKAVTGTHWNGYHFFNLGKDTNGKE